MGEKIMMKVLLIYNPNAGLKTGHEFQEITSFFEKRQEELVVFETTAMYGPAEYFADHTIAVDRIVVAGGDGTVSQLIQAMVMFDVDVPIVIVPTGTTNELASSFDVPTGSIATALSYIDRPSVERVDVGRFGGDRTFTYSLTFGNFTHVTYRTPQKWKNRIGHTAYWLYGFLTFRALKEYRYKITAAEFESEDDFAFGGISNSLTVGNIIHYSSEDVDFSDGRFEVLLIKKPKRFGQFSQIIRGLMHRDYTSDLFKRFKTSHVVFTSEEPHSWNADGEFAGKVSEVVVMNLNRRIEIVK